MFSRPRVELWFNLGWGAGGECSSISGDVAGRDMFWLLSGTFLGRQSQ